MINKEISIEYQDVHNVINNEVHDKNEARNICMTILEMQEQDRHRIARDIHDSSIQSLTAMLHKLELCMKYIDTDAIKAKLEIATMLDTLRNSINEMREIIYNLKPMTLDDLGLALAVKHFADQIISNRDIKVTVTYNEEVSRISQFIKTTMFRIIQEACNNAIKHSKANKIDINILYEKSNMNVSICDNGVGFDVEEQLKKGTGLTSGFGLNSMCERTNLLFGTIKINSTKEKGTNIIVSVPYKNIQGGK